MGNGGQIIDRAVQAPKFLNANTTSMHSHHSVDSKTDRLTCYSPSPEFAVNGTAIPDVDFDVGESYAGSLPISGKPNEEGNLFFWFFPSTNPAAKDEILIWLNGGVSFPVPSPDACQLIKSVARLFIIRGTPP